MISTFLYRLCGGDMTAEDDDGRRVGSDRARDALLDPHAHISSPLRRDHLFIHSDPVHLPSWHCVCSILIHFLPVYLHKRFGALQTPVVNLLESRAERLAPFDSIMRPGILSNIEVCLPSSTSPCSLDLAFATLSPQPASVLLSISLPVLDYTPHRPP